MPERNQLGHRLAKKRHVDVLVDDDESDCDIIDVTPPAKRSRSNSHSSVPTLFSNIFKRIGEWFKKTSEQTNTKLFRVSSESNSAADAIAHGGQYLEEASNDKFMPSLNGNGGHLADHGFSQQANMSKHGGLREGSQQRAHLAQGVFVNGEGCFEGSNQHSGNANAHGNQVYRAAAGYNFTSVSSSAATGGAKITQGGNITLDSTPPSSETSEHINGVLQKSYIDKAVRHRQASDRAARSSTSLYDKSFTTASPYTSNYKSSKHAKSSNQQCFDLMEKERYKRLLQQYSSSNSSLLSRQSISLTRISTNPGATSTLLSTEQSIHQLFSVGGETPSLRRSERDGAVSKLFPRKSENSAIARRQQLNERKDAVKSIKPSEITQKCDNLVKKMTEIQNRNLARMAEQKQLRAEELKLAEWDRMRVTEDEHLERMVQQRLKLSAKVILEDLPPPDVEEVDEFPELSDEAEMAVSKVWQRGPNNVLSEAFRLKITRNDMITLYALNWLNDEIVNFYFNLIQDRSGKDDLPSVYVFNTFFYPKVMKDGHKGVRRWTKQVDLFTKDFILIPIHLGMHWCLAIINIRDKLIQYFDSMGGANPDCLIALKRYMEDESEDKKKQVLDTSNWVLECVKDIPQQMNGSDCGVFACKYAEYLSRDAPITFSQENMPYFRKRMVYEILTKKLM